MEARERHARLGDDRAGRGAGHPLLGDDTQRGLHEQCAALVGGDAVHGTLLLVWDSAMLPIVGQLSQTSVPIARVW